MSRHNGPRRIPPDAVNVVGVQKPLNETPNNGRMIRPVCLAVIVAVMADQMMFGGQFMAGVLGMLAEILRHI